MADLDVFSFYFLVSFYANFLLLVIFFPLTALFHMFVFDLQNFLHCLTILNILK